MISKDSTSLKCIIFQNPIKQCWCTSEVLDPQTNAHNMIYSLTIAFTSDFALFVWMTARWNWYRWKKKLLPCCQISIIDQNVCIIFKYAIWRCAIWSERCRLGCKKTLSSVVISSAKGGCHNYSHLTYGFISTTLKFYWLHYWKIVGLSVLAASK